MKNNRKVVVTGIGVLAACGTGKKKLWQALESGRPQFKKVQNMKLKPALAKTGGQITDFKVKTRDSFLVRANKYCQYTYVTGQQAVMDAKLSIRKGDPYKAGVLVGTNFAHPLIERYADAMKIGPSVYVNPNVAAFLVSRKNGVKGVVMTSPCGEHASASCLALGFDLIQWGRCDTVIVGGADVMSRACFLYYSTLFELSPTGERMNWVEKCTPYDKKRNGATLSEGSAFVVIEEKEHASRRGAKVYCEIEGVGSAYSPAFTTHDFKSDHIEASMQKALKSSGLREEEIDLIYGSGNGGKKMDKAELNAFRNVFKGARKNPPISSVKSIIGETLGASGVFNLLSAIYTFDTNIMIPIVGFKKSHFKFRKLKFVKEPQDAGHVNSILLNSIGYTGRSVSIIAKRTGER